MTLKVIRYQNYGCTMIGEEENTVDNKDKFYFCFFELSSGKIINSQFIEYWKGDKYIGFDLHFYPENCYEFGQEFHQWFERTFDEEIDDIDPLSRDEEKCVESFFFKQIEDKRHEKTKIIYV